MRCKCYNEQCLKEQDDLCTVDDPDCEDRISSPPEPSGSSTGPMSTDEIRPDAQEKFGHTGDGHGEGNPKPSCSARIVRELQRRGLRGKRFQVKIRGMRELDRFIKTMNEASEQAAKSTTLYGHSG